MTAPRTWTITITAPCPWLTANDRRHWAAQAELVKQWRLASCLAARWAKLPTGLDRVRIDAVAHFRGRPPVRDRDNLQPTLKAVIDGLGPEKQTKKGKTPGYGLVPDDSDKHLAGTSLAIGEKLPRMPFGQPGEMVLLITEVTA